MNFSDYFNTREGALRENHVTRYVMILLAVAIVILAFMAQGKETVVVLVPPMLEEKTEISSSEAGDPYKTSWGLFFATLLGNVTPRSAEHVTENIGRYAHPAAYKTMLEQVAAQVELIEQDKLTISFAPTQVFFNEANKHVVVTGEFVIRGLRDAEKKMLRTYEIGVDVRNYRVALTSVVAYEGPWSPDRELKEELARQDTERQERENKARAASKEQ